MYEITVTLTTGKEYKHPKSDYYIQDGILTVFREKYTKDRERRYCPYHTHYPMSSIARIECMPEEVTNNE